MRFEGVLGRAFSLVPRGRPPSFLARVAPPPPPPPPPPPHGTRSCKLDPRGGGAAAEEEEGRRNEGRRTGYSVKGAVVRAREVAPAPGAEYHQL